MMDDLTRARLRHAILELENLAPDMALMFWQHPEHGALLRQALGDRRRWACPLCGLIAYGVEAPDGWQIVEPFTRVASCRDCRPVLAGHHRSCLCGHSRAAHAFLCTGNPCQRYGCGCGAFKAHP